MIPAAQHAFQRKIDRVRAVAREDCPLGLRAEKRCERLTRLKDRITRFYRQRMPRTPRIRP